jgi:peptide chain release factor 2
LGGVFDTKNKSDKIKVLESTMNNPKFWDDLDNANKVNKELINLKKELNDYNKINNKINELYELSSEDDLTSMEEIIESELEDIKKLIDSLEINTLLSGKYDELDCILEIHPGAGGTESCDWASMLLRMYQRFCEKNDYKYQVIDLLKGEEAGIKSVTLSISGNYPYGYFKGETGVHRLVRISPFDSNKRRHTSFASVLVTPQFKEVDDVEIKENDLKIDVFHSSGAGGQSVNTSDSAVRITHIPSKIVVSCQVERSQLLNKNRAMEMLKSKLKSLEIEKQQEQLNNEKGLISSINFGSQIRSYVLEPYTLVKDSRSNYETSQAFKVLDGDIKKLMESVLRAK